MFKIRKESRYCIQRRNVPMKKYVSCFLFFFSVTAVCLVTLFVMTVKKEPEEAKEVQVLESVEKRCV